MRCEVLFSKDSTNAGLFDQTALNTDVEIWREATAYRTALAVTPGGNSRDLVKVATSNTGNVKASRPRRCGLQSRVPVEKSSENSEGIIADLRRAISDPIHVSDSSNNTERKSKPGDCGKNDMVDSTLPPVDRKHQHLSELKANCKPEELHKLKVRCEILVRDCIAGLLVQLSVDDFQQIEEDLNRAVCWFLTCDRYWEDHNAADNRAFPWGLLFLTVMVLSLGVCLCYYVVWVLFDGDDGTSVASTSGSITAPSSPSRPILGGVDPPTPMTTPEDFNEHYIYVTYPPELKRRIMER